LGIQPFLLGLACPELVEGGKGKGGKAHDSHLDETLRRKMGNEILGKKDITSGAAALALRSKRERGGPRSTYCVHKRKETERWQQEACADLARRHHRRKKKGEKEKKD